MKKYLFLLVIAAHSLLWGAKANATTCPVSSSTLSGYIGLGASGCTIGSLNFSNFLLRASQNGAIPSTAITVTPVFAGASMVGVQFGVSPTSSGGLFYDDLITYRVTGVAAMLTATTVDFTGSSTTGDAAVSVLEQLCLGGTFGMDGVSGCSTSNTVALTVFNIGSVADSAISQSFAAVGSAGVATDIAYDSGFAAGSGSTLTSAINLFSFVSARAVPEPGEGLLLVIGLLSMAIPLRLRARRRSI